MKREERDRDQIEIIMRYCERLQISIAHFGHDFEKFASNEPYQDSCSLCLIQIGEAVNRLSDDFKREHPQIEWVKIYGMRNHLVHAYEMFDAEIAWDAIENYLPALYAFCQERVS